jgi:hypothetical protein
VVRFLYGPLFGLTRLLCPSSWVIRVRCLLDLRLRRVCQQSERCNGQEGPSHQPTSLFALRHGKVTEAASVRLNLASCSSARVRLIYIKLPRGEIRNLASGA